MKRKWIAAGLGLWALGGAAMVALAQSYPVPQVTSIGSGDLFQDIVGGAPQVGNVYAPAPLLGNYSATLSGNNPENALRGGDIGKNLFAFGTSVTGITTTSTYVANGWFAWSGTSTTLAGNQETGASDIGAGFEASLRLTRSGAGVLQSCVAQEIESNDTYRFQGNTAEFDFRAQAGSGFSAASSNLQVYLVTGTGTDEGSNKMAFGLNAQNTGNAAVGWTGQANLGPILIPITTSYADYSAVFPVPAAATELAVVVCWKPVGASPSSDWFEFSMAQLVTNSSLTVVAGAAGAALNVNDPRKKSFNRRSQQTETALQQRYAYLISETSTNAIATGVAVSTTSTRYWLQNPVTMARTPTPTAAFGSMTTTNSAGNAANLSNLASTSSGSSVYGVELTGTTTGTAAGNGTLLAGNSGTGTILVNAEE
jgi:hypothetical protein